MTRIWVSDMTVIVAALVLPNPTSVAPVKPVPVMVTVSPPVEDPESGDIDVTAGASAL